MNIDEMTEDDIQHELELRKQRKLAVAKATHISLDHVTKALATVPEFVRSVYYGVTWDGKLIGGVPELLADAEMCRTLEAYMAEESVCASQVIQTWKGRLTRGRALLVPDERELTSMFAAAIWQAKNKAFIRGATQRPTEETTHGVPT